MTRRRRYSAALAALALVTGAVPTLVSAGPGTADGSPEKATEIRADLDGRPIDPGRVGDFYCHDFDYPTIHCYRDPEDLELEAAPAVASTAVDYLVIFDYTSFQGPYMFVSQNYTALVFIGWNDRVSSFMARNAQSGKLWTDWFYSGTPYYFCCNQQQASLGSFNNTFSSVHRT